MTTELQRKLKVFFYLFLSGLRVADRVFIACRKQGLSVNSRDVNKFVGYKLNLLRLTHSTLRGVFKASIGGQTAWSENEGQTLKGLQLH